MKQSTFLKFLFLALVSTVLLGCAKSTFTVANKNIDKNSNTIRNIKAAADAPIPPVVSHRSYYSSPKPINPEDRALWLKHRVNIRGEKVPLSFLMSRIFRNTDVVVKYNPKVKKEKLVSINYQGTIKGALAQIVSQTNYAYEIDNDTNELIWEALITKTFNISFMPGSSTYVVGQTSSSGSSSGSTNTIGSSASSKVGNLMSNDQQYSGLQAASLSVWEDLRKTLDELKSPDGKISVSEATTMVTVYDHPNNVEAIGRYIDQLNKNLSQQVRLKVQVLSVDLDKEHIYGINWGVVQHVLGGSVGVSGNFGTAVAGAAGGGVGQLASGVTSPMQLTIGTDNSKVVLDALSTQGKVSIVTEPSLTTMNNQVAEIRISRDVSYLQNVSVTTGSGVNDTISTSLTPGVVTDGLILYLLPKISNSKVYLQISSILSDLLSLDTVSSSGQINQPTGTDTTATGEKKSLNAIQIPTLAEKRFNIRTFVPNGSTLVVGGFKQTSNQTRESKPFGIKAAGGEGAKTTNSETVLLITPTIIEN